MQAIIIQDHMKPDSSVKGVTMIATMGDFSFIGIHKLSQIMQIKYFLLLISHLKEHK